MLKKKVFEAAFSSAVLGGCEAWLKVPLILWDPLQGRGESFALLGARTAAPNLAVIIIQNFLINYEAEYILKVSLDIIFLFHQRAAWMLYLKAFLLHTGQQKLTQIPVIFPDLRGQKT